MYQATHYVLSMIYVFKLKCGLYGERDALVNLQTDIWEKIELVNKKILLLEPKKKKRYTGSNVY